MSLLPPNAGDVRGPRPDTQDVIQGNVMFEKQNITLYVLYFSLARIKIKMYDTHIPLKLLVLPKIIF